MIARGSRNERTAENLTVTQRKVPDDIASIEGEYTLFWLCGILRHGSTYLINIAPSC